jgi:hypothetical protein
MDSVAWRHECLSIQNYQGEQRSTAHIFREAALQTADRFNVKPGLVIVHQGRVHEDGGNLEDGRRSMLDKYILLLQF